MLNSEEIMHVTLSIVELCLADSIISLAMLTQAAIKENIQPIFGLHFNYHMQYHISIKMEKLENCTKPQNLILPTFIRLYSSKAEGL